MNLIFWALGRMWVLPYAQRPLFQIPSNNQFTFCCQQNNIFNLRSLAITLLLCWSRQQERCPTMYGWSPSFQKDRLPSVKGLLNRSIHVRKLSGDTVSPLGKTLGFLNLKILHSSKWQEVEFSLWQIFITLIELDRKIASWLTFATILSWNIRWI